jgi:hypothetical protein
MGSLYRCTHQEADVRQRRAQLGDEVGAAAVREQIPVHHREHTLGAGGGAVHRRGWAAGAAPQPTPVPRTAYGQYGPRALRTRSSTVIMV